MRFSSFSSYYFPWLYCECVEFSETCDQVSFIPFLSGIRGAFSFFLPWLVSNHDRSNHDRRITSENPGVYIAIKSAVRVPHSSFRLVKFFKNLNIPSQWNGIIINKLSKVTRRNSHFCCTVWRHKTKKPHKNYRQEEKLCLLK